METFVVGPRAHVKSAHLLGPVRIDRPLQHRRWPGHEVARGQGHARDIVRGTIESLWDGERSRVTIDLDFEGHGIGKLLAPLLVRRQARMEMPKNQQRLKELLERGA